MRSHVDYTCNRYFTIGLCLYYFIAHVRRTVYWYSADKKLSATNTLLATVWPFPFVSFRIQFASVPCCILLLAPIKPFQLDNARQIFSSTLSRSRTPSAVTSSSNIANRIIRCVYCVRQRRLSETRPSNLHLVYLVLTGEHRKVPLRRTQVHPLRFVQHLSHPWTTIRKEN